MVIWSVVLNMLFGYPLFLNTCTSEETKFVSFKNCMRCWIIDLHICIYSMLAFCVCHVSNVR